MVHKRKVDIVLLAPTFEEREALFKYLPHRKSILNKPDIFPEPFDEGKIIVNQDEHLIRLVTLGEAGPQKTQQQLQLIIEYWDPSYIFLVGVAGGYQDRGVELFDFLIPKDIIAHELYKKTED